MGFLRKEPHVPKPEHNPFNLEELIRQVIQSTLSSLDDKEINITLDYQKDSPRHFNGDAFRLKQVFFNLLHCDVESNTREEISINVFTKEVNGSKDCTMVQTIISHSGKTIPPGQLENISGAFSRAKGASKPTIQGVGLKLAVAKGLVEMMDGSIQALSEEKKGTMFNLRLKLQNTDEAENVTQILGTNTLLNEQEADTRILIVEDNKFNRELILKILERGGLKAYGVNDGKACLEILQTQKFDLIFMDLYMPYLDGFETARRIRSELKSNVPIVALTGDTFDETRERALAAGMNAFISKPFSKNQILETVTRLLKLLRFNPDHEK